MPPTGGSFADLFVGGGSVTVAAAERYPTAHITVNDLNAGIAAFWSVAAAGRCADLATLVSEALPSVDLFDREQLFLAEYSPIDDPYGQETIRAAYATLLLHRLSHGSMGLRPRAGRYFGTDGKHRESETADDIFFKWVPDEITTRWSTGEYVLELDPRDRPLTGRWAPKSTVRNLASLAPLAGRLTVRNGRAWEVPGEWDCLYLDPPYVAEGPALYQLSMTTAEHHALADWLHERDRWVLSYDDHPLVRELYSWATISEFTASYTVGAKKEATELLITPK